MKEPSPGTFRLDHDRGRHDDRVIALALTASALLASGALQRARTWSSFHVGGRQPRVNWDAQDALALQLRERGVRVSGWH